MKTKDAAVFIFTSGVMIMGAPFLYIRKYVNRYTYIHKTCHVQNSLRPRFNEKPSVPSSVIVI